MKPIDYFKLQAKNLHRDYKTKVLTPDSENGGYFYEYKPKYFNILGLILHFDPEEETFGLMTAQHLIAQLAGFKKWTDMGKASEVELKLAKLLFDNMHKISAEEWDWYILGVESDNNFILDPESKLDILQQVFVDVDGHESLHGDFRLHPNQIIFRQEQDDDEEEVRQVQTPGVKISSRPLSNEDRKEFIEVANSVFETVMWRMEPEHPELTRKLWGPEFYIDNLFLRNDMLPIDKDYALSLIYATLFHHVAELAAKADKIAANSN